MSRDERRRFQEGERFESGGASLRIGKGLGQSKTSSLFECGLFGSPLWIRRHLVKSEPQHGGGLVAQEYVIAAEKRNNLLHVPRRGANIDERADGGVTHICIVIRKQICQRFSGGLMVFLREYISRVIGTSDKRAQSVGGGHHNLGFGVVQQVNQRSSGGRVTDHAERFGGGGADKGMR